MPLNLDSLRKAIDSFERAVHAVQATPCIPGFDEDVLNTVKAWMDYHQARNRTSHTYDQDVADEVLETARKFLPEARALLEAIERRND